MRSQSTLVGEVSELVFFILPFHITSFSVSSCMYIVSVSAKAKIIGYPFLN